MLTCINDVGGWVGGWLNGGSPGRMCGCVESILREHGLGLGDRPETAKWLRTENQGMYSEKSEELNV